MIGLHTHLRIGSLLFDTAQRTATAKRIGERLGLVTTERAVPFT